MTSQQRRLAIGLGAIIALIVLTIGVGAMGNDYVLSWFTFASGGMSNGGGYTMHSVIGQSVAGTASGGGYNMVVGYGAGLQSVDTPTPNPTTATPTPTLTKTPTPTPTLTPTFTPTLPAMDTYEPDDTCTQASPITTDGLVQVHNFHQSDDQDWVSFQSEAGKTYLIEAQIPDDSVADVVLEIQVDCQGNPTAGQNYVFAPGVRMEYTSPMTGPVYLHWTNHAPEVSGPNARYHLSVRKLGAAPSPGAVIIVAGRLKNGDFLQENIHNVTNEVYRLFRLHGYSADRIQYLATDLSLDADNDGVSDVDLMATRVNLAQSITQWAADRVGPNQALTLYLMDHGDHDKFYLNGHSETVSPDALDDWLDTLDAAVPVNVIVESCQSGSVIDLDESLSAPGRVVISSTGAYALAYASTHGAFFSDTFINALSQDLSLYAAFTDARSSAYTAHPDQTAWLDDNGDGRSNEADGALAQVRGFAYAGTLADGIEWPPYIAEAGVGEIVNGSGVIYAKVLDDGSVRDVWAVIYKPSYLPPPVSNEMVQENLPTPKLLDSDGDGVFTTLYESFSEPGPYRVALFAEDNDGNLALVRSITVLGGKRVMLPMVAR